ncbi:glycoside hydrolase superfamily [Aspergillus aurantiobrunneus]
MRLTDLALFTAAALPGGVLATGSSSSSLLSSGTLNLGAYQSAYDKAKQLIDALNTIEKVSLITGGSIDGVWTALESKDGMSGVNQQYYVSSFPLGNALSMTWNRTRAYEQFRATGREFYELGYNLVNGPMPGPLGRTPWGGRGAETFSPDPYLSGILMAESIAGQNDAGVISAGRHFILNEQETNRMGMGSSGAYSANAGDKATHELYLWPFADGVQAGMGAIMCGMNRVNGTYACEHESSLTGMLKAELGFPGLVLADVGGQKTSYNAANAGLDYGSSQYWSNDIITAGLRNGSLTEARLDDMAIRNVIAYFYVGLDDGQQPSVADTTANRNVRADHAELIRQVGAESMVLLKNDAASGRGLPLNDGGSLAIFGAHASWPLAGPNQEFSIMGSDGDTYQGHLTCPTGSGAGSAAYVVPPQMALALRQRDSGGMLWWISNDTFASSDNSSPSGAGAVGGAGSGTTIAHSYANYAATSEACLVFLNAMSGEGADRGELYNADQDAMVLEVAENCNNTIVVINTVGPRLMEGWIEHENVTAVLYGGLLGQESGFAITDVLYGDVNPSGKLTHIIGKNASDYPASICETTQCNFTEGVYIDYRWFDAKKITPRYEFGHGLSYTSFKYGRVSAQVTNHTALSSRYPTGPRAVGGNEDLFDEVVTVATTVSNTGNLPGAEVVQLYVSFPREAAQPVRVLRGFEKTLVPVGGEKKATFALRRRDLSYWDVGAQQWAVARGLYRFSVGASSLDIRESVSLTI